MKSEVLFTIVWGIATASILTLFYVNSVKAMAIFPALSTVKIRYRDKSASGYSNKNWKSKMGTSRNTIDLIVTENELWIRSMLLFAWISKKYDLLHKIPFENITKIEKQDQKVLISFKNESSDSNQIVLLTNNTNQFLQALNE